MTHKKLGINSLTLICLVLNLIGSLAAVPAQAAPLRNTITFTGEELLGKPADTNVTADVAVIASFAEATDQSPNQPVLVQPPDGATDVSTSPTLEVTVTDSEADTMSVSFYGRATDSGEDFTLVVIPDTQQEAESYPYVMYEQFAWIADQQTARNIVFATSVGDIVQIASSYDQWDVADYAYSYLDDDDVPYSVGPGNHDIGTGSRYEEYFGVDRFSGMPWYGGHYGSDNYNNYSLFSASGMDFILINLQYEPTYDHLDWADDLLKDNPNRRGIVVQHDILDIDNSWNNQDPYIALKDNPNLFLMLCGHMHAENDGAAYREELGDDGHTIHIMMANYQEFDNGGNGYLRILRFAPTDDTIYATTYSPYVPGYITTYPDQMEMAYEMVGSSSFTLIGTVSGVASGANASITWPDLDSDTEYEWYVEIFDGSATTTGSTWSFTTESAPTYDLTTDVKPGAGGTIHPAEGVHTYVEGSVVNITATAEDGYTFNHWSGNCTGTGDCQVTMNGDKSVTAHFEVDTFTLEYAAGTGGRLRGDTWQRVDYGEDGTAVTAVPYTGYYFVEWSDGVTDNPRTDTDVTEDVDVTAIFAAYTFTLDYAAGTGGSLSGDTWQRVDYGEDGTPVTAVPYTGHHFVAWSDGSTDNPRTDTNVTEDVGVTATFAINTYTLDYAAGTGGSLTGDTAQTVDYGEDGTPVTALPGTGHHFVAWSDGSTDNPRTDTNVTEDVDVTATFAIDTFTLDYAAGTGGSLTGDTAQTVDYGEDGTPVTAVSGTGHHFVAWSDGSTDNPRTDMDVTKDVAVTATFAIDTFTLDYAAGTGGNLTGDTAQRVNYGENGTPVTAAPDTGHHFVAWSDGSTDNPRIDTVVTADVAVTATFALNTYALEYTAGTGGSLSGDTSQMVDYGEDGTPVTAAPDTGHHFVNWSDGDTDNPRTDTAVTADVAVTATFALNTYTLDYAAGMGGSLSGDTSQTVDYGEDGTPVTAVPDMGYLFVAWSDGSTGNPRIDTNITADVVVTATFALNTYTLDYAAGMGGSLSGDTSQTVNYGKAGTPVTAVPDTGYHFVAWSDGSTDNPRIDAVVTAGVTVTATFAINTYTLDYAAGIGGSLSGDTSQTVNYGEDGTPVTATPDTGYHFVAWSDGSTGNPRIDTDVTADVTVTATFTLDEYTLDVNIDPKESGSVEIDPEQATYHYGEVVTLTAQPGTGWAFVGWSGDLIDINNPVALTMDIDRVITATFSPIIPTCVAITDVSLRQTMPDIIHPDDIITFSAALHPLGLTTPYSYTINGDVTVTGSANPLDFTLTYTAPGTYTVELAAWNCALTSPLTDTVQVIVTPSLEPSSSYSFYLPLIARKITP